MKNPPRIAKNSSTEAKKNPIQVFLLTWKMMKNPCTNVEKITLLITQPTANPVTEPTHTPTASVHALAAKVVTLVGQDKFR